MARNCQERCARARQATERLTQARRSGCETHRGFRTSSVSIQKPDAKCRNGVSREGLWEDRKSRAWCSAGGCAGQSEGIGRGKCTRSLATLRSSTWAPERAKALIISSTNHSGDEALAVSPSARTPSSIEGSTSAIESTRNARAPPILATSTLRLSLELCFEPPP